jgi:hypothetical protein
VQGVKYVSGAQSGTTGADGGFIYEENAPISFYLGGLKLGSVAMATKYITPIDLVSGGSISKDAVLNIAAFLQSLDANANPADGITISPATQAVAASWGESQINFNQTYAAFSGQAIALTGLNLPSKADTVAHLSTSVRCLHSGVFVGSWTEVGGVSGIGGYFVKPSTGVIAGAYVANDQSSFGSLTGSQGLALDQSREFVSGDASNGAIFSGSLSPDIGALSGTWSIPSTTIVGSFVGKRLDDSYNGVKYRVSGFVQMTVPDFLLYSINIRADGRASGKFFSLKNNWTVDIVGDLVGSGLSVATSSGEFFVANIDPMTGAVSNPSWSGGLSAGQQVRSDVGGCLLNGLGV